MISDYAESAVRDLVNERPVRIIILEKCGIDFCCGGERKLADACRSAGANVDYVCGELAALDDQPMGDDEPDWSHMSLSELVDDISEHHHPFLRRELPRLDSLCRDVLAEHGADHPELRNIRSILRALADELNHHMLKEEHTLFPCVKALEAARHQRRAVPIFRCGSISNPINMMLRDHQDAGDALHAIRRLTHDFTPPRDAGSAYHALLQGLKELSRDLHLHMHKENNLLFPRAVELEEEMAAL